MIQPQLAGSGASSARDALVISGDAAEGFRIYSVTDPHATYIVSGTWQKPHCTCPVFNGNGNGAGHLCEHVLAVQQQLKAAYGDPSDAAERFAIQNEHAGNGVQLQPAGNGAALAPIAASGRKNSFEK